MNRSSLLLIAVVSILAAAGGYWASNYGPFESAALSVDGDTPTRETNAGGSVIDQPMPSIALPDLDGNVPAANQWQDQVLVVNFWATWCAPCLEEIPMFTALQTQFRDQAVTFIGIALDDVERVRVFAEEVGMNYPIFIGGTDAIALGKAFGNTLGALPFSAIVNRDGTIVETHFGVFERADLDAKLRALL
ncbi:MAG: TlpA disulfide reductase family protein [Pseudomonadota bacterium]